TGTLGAEDLQVSGRFAGRGTLNATLNLSGTFGSATGHTELAITGDATFAETSDIHLHAGGDTVAIAGGLGLAGALHLRVARNETFGRFPLFTYGGALDLGAVQLTGVTAAHLSTTTPGQVDLVLDDSDEDGLPDSWETHHFGNLAQGSD